MNKIIYVIGFMVIWIGFALMQDYVFNIESNSLIMLYGYAVGSLGMIIADKFSGGV